MNRLSYKISLPVILSGVFAVTIFIALNYQNANPQFYIVLLLLTLFTFFFGFATGQNLTSPIKELLDKAQQLSDGKLSTRVYLESKDELAELAKVFNRIAEELQMNDTERKKAEQFLDIKVRARTKDLEDTVNSLDEKVRNRSTELERMMKDSAALQAAIKEKEDEVVKLQQQLDDTKTTPAAPQNPQAKV
jgi:methyl-accepting chemotaxis protein